MKEERQDAATTSQTTASDVVGSGGLGTVPLEQDLTEKCTASKTGLQGRFAGWRDSRRREISKEAAAAAEPVHGDAAHENAGTHATRGAIHEPAVPLTPVLSCDAAAVEAPVAMSEAGTIHAAEGGKVLDMMVKDKEAMEVAAETATVVMEAARPNSSADIGSKGNTAARTGARAKAVASDVIGGAVHIIMPPSLEGIPVDPLTPHFSTFFGGNFVSGQGKGGKENDVLHPGRHVQGPPAEAICVSSDELSSESGDIPAPAAEMVIDIRPTATKIAVAHQPKPESSAVEPAAASVAVGDTVLVDRLGEILQGSNGVGSSHDRGRSVERNLEANLHQEKEGVATVEVEANLKKREQENAFFCERQWYVSLRPRVAMLSRVNEICLRAPWPSSGLLKVLQGSSRVRCSAQADFAISLCLFLFVQLKPLRAVMGRIEFGRN